MLGFVPLDGRNTKRTSGSGTSPNVYSRHSERALDPTLATGPRRHRALKHWRPAEVTRFRTGSSGEASSQIPSAPASDTLRCGWALHEMLHGFKDESSSRIHILAGINCRRRHTPGWHAPLCVNQIGRTLAMFDMIAPVAAQFQGRPAGGALRRVLAASCILCRAAGPAGGRSMTLSQRRVGRTRG
jgi:hypothetical protein